MRIQIVTLFLAATPLLAQHQHSHQFDRKIEFPDVSEYKTLKCDFHQHTVFSDGKVWPSIRVQEALKDGLDAISLTEHIEYQPHKDDIPHPDRNRAYQIALEEAKDRGLIVVNGSEITRDMPPGHSNAIFLKDANPLVTDDPLDAFRAAKKQGAFIFWNHPHWERQVPDGIAKLTEMHHQLIREGLLSGIEVVNDVTYSDEALQIALDRNLTIMGTSDIHGLVDWQYDVPTGGHRPITLVFAKEKSAESIKEGLEERRTVVWFNNLLIGRDAMVVPLINQCLSVKKAAYMEKTTIMAVSIENNSDVRFMLQNQSAFTLHGNADLITLEPHSTTDLKVKTREKRSSFNWKFTVLNAVTAPARHPNISLAVKVTD